MTNPFAYMASSRTLSNPQVGSVLVVTMLGPQTWVRPRGVWFISPSGNANDMYRPLYGFRIKTLK